MSEKIEDAAVQLETIRLGAQTLFKPKQLVEVRVMLTAGYWRGLYFTDHEYMATVVRDLDVDSRVQSIYYVFNRINPKLIEQRAACQCDRCTGGGLIVANPDIKQVQHILNGPSQHLTTNEDVENLNWLFIDVDTTRAPGFEHESSCREEKRAALGVANKIVAHLEGVGWSSPLLANSGNGFHILPRINLPNTDSNIALLLDCLKALATKFNCPEAEIDDSVFNAARLTRAYGSHTRKGTSTNERPWRQNHVIPPKGVLTTASLDQIIALGADAPKSDRTARGDMPLLHPTFDPDDFFRHFEEEGAFEVTGSNTWQGHEIKIIDHCVISGTKHTGSKLTGFIIGDSFGYHCWSPECGDPNIGDVLRKLADDGYKRYPKKIWVEEDLSNFAEDVTALEQAMEAEKQQFESSTPKAPPKIAEVSPEVQEIEEDTSSTPFKAVAVKVAKEDETPLPQPPTEGRKRLVGKEPNELAEWLMGIMFRNPEKAYADFVMYKKRLEKVAPHLKAPVGESLAFLLLYEIDIRRLPSRAELNDYILNHPSCRNHKGKDAAVAFISELADDESKTFDVTVQALLEEVDWRLEKIAAVKAYDILNKERDVIGYRTYLRKHWTTSGTQDSNFQPGAWQESIEDIREAFRRDVAGEGDSRKFKLGFPSIDNSGMNIGLDGEHAIVICGPSANGKTTAALTLAYNFAREGKNGLFLAGEHQSMKIKKRLTLMFAQEMREQIGIIPSLNKWEGLNRSATWDDFENIDKVLSELRMMRLVPGFIEIQNINAMARGEDDRLGSIFGYAEATFKKYQWDFMIIDPLDTVMPPSTEGQSNWKACSEIVDRLFDFSRDAFGGKACMVVTTAQFGSNAQRDIEKVQQKNVGPDDYDDEIASLLKKNSSIQYFTTIGQRFDLCIGVGLRVKSGSEGMLVQGRSREGGLFDVVDFKMDQHSNLMSEKEGAVHTLAAGVEQTIQHDGPMDDL